MDGTVRKVVFMGSPAFAVPSLRAVAKAFEVVAVYTQPPRPAGRGKQVQKTAVHEEAEKLGLPVFHPERLRRADLDALLALACDAVCVVAYGLLLPRVLVDARVCLNVHPSALPRWRGAAPLQWTLLAGDPWTEGCVMRLDAGMDTGPVYLRERLPVPPDMAYGKLHELCAVIGAEKLVEVLKALPEIRPASQTGKATHARKIEGIDRWVDWTKDSAEVVNRIRALDPSPAALARLAGEDMKMRGAQAVEGHGAPGEILDIRHNGVVVACGTGAVIITLLQRPGKTMQHVQDMAHGWSALAVGNVFDAD